MKALVRKSTENHRTLKINAFCAHPLPKSRERKNAWFPCTKVGISKFSRISGSWPGSPLFSALLGLSKTWKRMRPATPHEMKLTVSSVHCQQHISCVPSACSALRSAQTCSDPLCRNPASSPQPAEEHCNLEGRAESSWFVKHRWAPRILDQERRFTECPSRGGIS